MRFNSFERDTSVMSKVLNLKAEEMYSIFSRYSRSPLEGVSL